MKRILTIIIVVLILQSNSFPQITVTLPNIERPAGSTDEYIPIAVDNINEQDSICGYSFFLYYDKNIIHITEASGENTITGSSGLFNADIDNGVFKFAFIDFNLIPLRGSGTLIKLKVSYQNAGTTKLSFRGVNGENTLTFEDDTNSIVNEGSITVKEPTSVEDDISFPSVFGLQQNYPNPFNPSTVFEFNITEPAYTTLKVYNIQGEETAVLVASELGTGRHTAVFNAAGFASGVYYARLQSGNNTAVKKIMLMK